MAPADGRLPALTAPELLRSPLAPSPRWCRLLSRCAAALLSFACAAIATGSGAPTAATEAPPADWPWPAITLELLKTGLPPLSGLAQAGDQRLFLTTLDGRILVWNDGAVTDPPFLDLRGQVSTGGERGLLGLAFHPRFVDNGVFFVAYTDPANSLVIARYRTAPPGGPGNPLSEQRMLVVQGYAAGHFSGQLHFGADGYLYASVGAGPWIGDAQCSGQRLDTYRGKILRLDVDNGADQPPYYSTPSSNPFSGGAFPEIWAYGLRNPWRFSFDRVTGDLYIGDVGEHDREEIDRQPASSPGGENYGWARMEGSYCVDLVVPCFAPVPPCGDPSFTPPVLEHEHVDGFCAIIGGYVYHGSEIPDLEGRYLYGDYCSGRLFAGRQGAEGWISEDLGLALPGLSSFGEDAAGEIYLTTASGSLARLTQWPGRSVGACQPGPTQLCLDGGRTWVAARWWDARGRTGLANAVPITSDAGYFWFFEPTNVELVVKLLDGCAAGSGARWLFAAGLTDVAVELRALDTVTGEEWRYVHPGGAPFPPIQDIGALACD